MLVTAPPPNPISPEYDREFDLGVDYLRQELSLEKLAPMPNERLADNAHALADLRCTPTSKRLVENELVDAVFLLASVLFRPCHPEPPLRGKLLHERTPFGCIDELGEVLARQIHHNRIVVLLEELRDLVLKCPLLWRKLKIHVPVLLYTKVGNTE